MKSYTAKIVKTYQKEFTIRATNENEAFRHASVKIAKDGSKEEILVKTEIVVAPATRA